MKKYQVVETNIKNLQSNLDSYSEAGWVMREIIWIQLNAKGFIVFETDAR